MQATGSRLFLVDTFGLIFRAYYGRARAAVPSLRTSAGLPTEAVYVFNNMLKRMLEDHRPEYVAAVWEGRGPTFREEIFPDYKANRDQMPEDLAVQLPYIERLLRAWNVPVVSENGYEADDTIGLLAGQAWKLDLDVWIVSSDKDLMQLVRDGVSVLNPMKGERYQAEDVEAFLGVKPENVTDLLALKGDSVDNIPGAPGIGDKGAQQLIASYGSVEEIIRNADEVRRKTYRESLQNHAEQIRLSKRLATLDTSGSLKLGLADVQRQSPDIPRLREFYEELEFHSLSSQLDAGAAPAKVDESSRTFESADQFAAWLKQSQNPLAVAIVGAAGAEFGDPETGGIGFTVRPGESWRLPVDCIQHAKELLEAGDREIWVHDWKSAIHALAGHGIRFVRATDDTMLMAFLADSSRTNYTLGKTVERRLAVPWKPDAATAAGQTRALREQLDGELDRLALRELYESIELPLIPVLARMESVGVLLDPGVLEDLSSRLQRNIEELGREIHELAGREFNIASPKQLGEVLYGDLGLRQPPKRGKTKTPSTASDVLEGLAHEHPIASRVLDWRQSAKLKNTYVDALPELAGVDKRLHTTFNPTGSATGRLSSWNPNLQNIPVRTELGREIRKAFVTEPGWLLVAADYSQIELRILAHMSGDDGLLEAFRSGEDIHTRTASEVLGIPPTLVGPSDRHRAKAVNFGIIYGLSAFGLAKQLGIPQRAAREYIDLYFERYSTVRQFIADTIERTRGDGCSRTLFGRRRPITDLDSRNPSARGLAERIAVNAPIQGTAADLIKRAMVAADAALRQGGFRARMLLQVHDELLLEVPDDEVDPVSALIKREMEAAADLAVPLIADIKAGLNWCDLKPYG